jgi:hypothetical protein
VTPPWAPGWCDWRRGRRSEQQPSRSAPEFTRRSHLLVSTLYRAEGFFFDHLRTPDGHRTPVKIKSFVGLIPLFASVTIEDRVLRKLPGFSARMAWFLKHRKAVTAPHYHAPTTAAGGCHLLSMVTRAQLPRLLSRLLSEDEFLSPHGIRSMSKEHEAVPFTFAHAGFHASLRYEPAESASEMFGGNSK